MRSRYILSQHSAIYYHHTLLWVIPSHPETLSQSRNKNVVGLSYQKCCNRQSKNSEFVVGEQIHSSHKNSRFAFSLDNEKQVSHQSCLLDQQHSMFRMSDRVQTTSIDDNGSGEASGVDEVKLGSNGTPKSSKSNLRPRPEFLEGGTGARETRKPQNESSSSSSSSSTSIGSVLEIDGLMDSEKLRLIGKEHQKAGDLVTARDYYRKCVEIDRLNGKGWQRLAKVQGMLNGGYRTSSLIIEEALRHMPKNPFLWQTRGVMAHKLGNAKLARQCFRRGLIVDPNHVPLYSTWGRVEAFLMNIRVARKIFETGAKIDPNCVRLLHAWSVFEQRQGDLGKARALLERAKVLEPENNFIWQGLGHISLIEGNLDHARECFHKALKPDKNNSHVLETLGRLEGKAGNYELAKQYLERSVQLNPRDSRVYQTWSIIELENGNPENALALARQSLRVNQKEPALINNMAKIEAAIGNYDIARELFRRSGTLNPNDWVCWDEWSCLEWKQGNWELAEKLLEHSFSIRMRLEEQKMQDTRAESDHEFDHLIKPGQSDLIDWVDEKKPRRAK